MPGEIAINYFVNAAERTASGHENHIEFQKPTAAEKFWGEESLYMSEDMMEDSEFGEFWNKCATEHGFGFTDTIYAADCSIMVEAAKSIGGTILEVVTELSTWLEAKYAKGIPYVEVVWASDRALARRQQQREAYPIDPMFYEDVRVIDNTLPFAEFQEEYEKLLRKYDMPSCFFSCSL